MNKYQITSHSRHLRYVFFIEEYYSYEKVFQLMFFNQSVWGGRFNPIIPVKDNEISDNYKDLLKNYDPDYVFYSKGVNPESIKKLKLFNPCGYYNLDENSPTHDSIGINSFYHISKFDINNKILFPRDIGKTGSILLDFYKLNFGLDTNSNYLENQVGKQYIPIEINQTNFSEINKIIHEQKPINKATLSRINTKILRNLDHAGYTSFEIVIAKDKTSIEDLIYYWNRQLFEAKNILYITKEELTELTKDKFFGGVLYDMSFDNPIHVVSKTLKEKEIKGLIENGLDKIKFHRNFKYKAIAEFPFQILDSSGLHERDYGESKTTQSLISEEGIIHVPKLSFTNKVGFSPQKWAIDLEIDTNTKHYSSCQLKFPSTTDTRFIVDEAKGRINKRRNISVILHNQINTSDSLGIKIPKFRNLLKQLICAPVIDGEVKKSKYKDIGPHDSSNKLNAFIKSFDFNFHSISDFFSDKFWIEIFNELCTSEKVTGQTISFETIKLKCKEALVKHFDTTLDENGTIIGNKEETNFNEGNLEIGLLNSIKELREFKVLHKGFNLKCQKCSSEFWYHINEVNEFIDCRGCMENFMLPVEPKFSYKLNDLIKNNMYQSLTDKNGNLTVIRTLAALNSYSHFSFDYSPQINLYANLNTKKPLTDIDIVCMSDGKLIIGEAKYDSAGFFEEKNKSLISLVEITKAIRPDVIILSCYINNKNKLQKAVTGLLHLLEKEADYIPEIDTMIIQEADFYQFNSSKYFYY